MPLRPAERRVGKKKSNPELDCISLLDAPSPESTHTSLSPAPIHPESNKRQPKPGARPSELPGARHWGDSRICQQRAPQGSGCVRGAGPERILPAPPASPSGGFSDAPTAEPVELGRFREVRKCRQCLQGGPLGAGHRGEALDWGSGIHMGRETLDTQPQGPHL